MMDSDDTLQVSPAVQPASTIFEGYRALGLVTNDQPFLLKYGKSDDELRIVTCVGRHFYTFNSKLALTEASHAHEFDINAMTHNERCVYTASNTEIFAWKHGHKKVSALCLLELDLLTLTANSCHTLTFESLQLRHVYRHHDNKIKQMLLLGEELITVDSESVLSIVHTGKDELIAQVPFHNYQFRITVLFHPPTYINKVLLGSEQGALQLFNVRKQKCIYQYEGWQSAVTCIEASPVIDVVAVGLQNGQIHLHNLKTDQTLLSFRQDWGRVVRISFRTDGPPVMVSTSELGHMAVWDIENRRLLTQMRNVHEGSITGCSFVFQEALLITSSSDNSLKVWRFDQSDGKGELLRKLQGHTLPPTKIDFYSPTSHYIVSAAGDSTIRLFSIFTERANKSLGAASLNRKASKHLGTLNDPFRMDPVIDFDFKVAREKEFDNLVALHRDSSMLTTWRVDHCRMGDHKLQHKKHVKHSSLHATRVLVSNCGNFAICGYDNGDILKFNIQSGMYRGAYKGEQPAAKLDSTDSTPTGPSPIVGLNCDQLCTVLVSAQASFLHFWNFKKGTHISTLKLHRKITKTRSNNQQNLMAIILENNSISVVDVETRSIIRTFDRQSSRINDVVFSSDSKWIICALANRSLLVFDLISTELVDHCLLPSACTSLTMSHSGEFLATAHEEHKGIFVWANMTMYTAALIRPLPNDHKPTLLDLPIGRPEEPLDRDDTQLNETDEQEQLDDPDTEMQDETKVDCDLQYESPEQISQHLISLSTVPASRWKNLIHLDLIKKRNKPKEPASKPKSAPFFLPVMAGVKPTLDARSSSKDADGEQSKIQNRLLLFSEFGQALFDAGLTKEYDSIVDLLKELGPSAIDVEIRSLDALPPQSSSGSASQQPILIQFFLEALLQRLESNRDFELCNAYLAVLLKCHSDVITRSASYSSLCARISAVLDDRWDRVKSTFSQTLCVLNYIRNSVI
jgi:U3 small nucleolar RNA-associated protein 21